MKSREQVLSEVKDQRLESEALDGRDFTRLALFMPIEDWPSLNVITSASAPADFAETFKPLDWTAEAIIQQMAEDVAFGFEKALNKRGLSADSMHAVIKMWLNILEDRDLFTLADNDGFYPQYGLPLLKAVAVKYGFPNPIGEDTGQENQYGSD